MLRSPTCTDGGGSRRDAREVAPKLCSGSARLLLEFFHGFPDMVDMRLNILLVRDSFFSFLSSRLSSPSWLWIEVDSLIRRPNGLQPLSDDVRDGAMLCSRECDIEGAFGEEGSVRTRPRVGLLGLYFGFWWSIIRWLWWRSNGVFWLGIDNIGCLVRSSRTMRAVTCTDSGCAFPL
jgi:hypothetical protein